MTVPRTDPPIAIPPGIAALPRFELSGGPSPFVPAPRLSAALGGGADIWLKREDLLPLAFGGNKIRNLELLVGDALRQGADCLVTSGRRWSNHCRLTAAAGVRAGLDVHLALSGPPGDPEPPNERLARLLGATVHVAATAERAERQALVERIVADLARAGRRPYLIGVGGTGSGDGDVVGACGQVIAGLELVAQATAADLEVTAVVVPTATGGTHAGILAGIRAAGSPAGVLGVAVAGRADPTRRLVADILARVASIAGVAQRVGEPDVVVDGDQLGDGYGSATLSATEAAGILARTEGVFVDPVYTAKALAGLIAGVREGRLTGTVVFWHAGGLPTLFGEPPERR